MTKTLEELKRENAKLKARREVKQDFLKRNLERKKIASENFKLKHEGKLRFAKGAGRIVAGTAKAVGKGAASAGRKIREADRKRARSGKKGTTMRDLL